MRISFRALTLTTILIFGNNLCLGQISPPRILLIGPTGAGKSSTINTFRNAYNLSRDSNAEIEYMIPIIIGTNVLGDRDVKKIGKDSSQSDTSEISSYQFDDRIFVDTPGWGDTKGADVDTQTLTFIESYLEKFSVNTIVLVNSSGNTRKTKQFNDMIEAFGELFGKEVVNNMVVFETHSIGNTDNTKSLFAHIDEKLAESSNSSSRYSGYGTIDNYAIVCMV